MVVSLDEFILAEGDWVWSLSSGEWPKVKAKLESGTLFKVHYDFARTWMDGLPLRVGTLAALPPTRLSNFG